MRQVLTSYRDGEGGNIALMTAILLPVLLLMGAAAVDFTHAQSRRASLQELSDALALRGAREFMLANANPTQIKLTLEEAGRGEMAEIYGLSGVLPVVTVDAKNTTVSVSASMAQKPSMLLSRFMKQESAINVASSAVASGGMNVCVIALEPTADRAISATFSAKLSAPECSILSNSTSSSGVYASGAAKLTAGLICSAGGKSGSAANFLPMPVLDCPPYLDPLAGRTPPQVDACDHFDLKLGGGLSATGAAIRQSFSMAMAGADGGGDTGQTTTGPDIEPVTLKPGVYCGGIEVGSNVAVSLEPGVYVMKDGPLSVRFAASITGENVGFYLYGDKSVFYFGAESKISLTAPKTGPLAGILFFEDRAAPLDRTHGIYSDDARTLLGTFYLPRGVFKVASQRPVADQSAYTAIVANKIQIDGGPTLVLNANYSLTDIPTPDGVGPVTGQVQLRM